MRSGSISQTRNTHTTTGPDPYTDDEKQKTVLFFNRLVLIYGKRFEIQWPDEKTLKKGKKEWAREIGKLSWQEIEQALARAKQRLIDGDGDYYWPDIGRILGLARDSRCAAHRVFRRALPEGDCLKQARRAAGHKGLSQVWAAMRGGHAD